MYLSASVIGTILIVIAFWQIYKKAGYDGAWALLWLFAPAGIVAALLLAFSEWPIERPVGVA